MSNNKSSQWSLKEHLPQWGSNSRPSDAVTVGRCNQLSHGAYKYSGPASPQQLLYIFGARFACLCRETWCIIDASFSNHTSSYQKHSHYPKSMEYHCLPVYPFTWIVIMMHLIPFTSNDKCNDFTIYICLMWSACMCIYGAWVK